MKTNGQHPEQEITVKYGDKFLIVQQSGDRVISFVGGKHQTLREVFRMQVPLTQEDKVMAEQVVMRVWGYPLHYPAVNSFIAQL